MEFLSKLGIHSEEKKDNIDNKNDTKININGTKNEKILTETPVEMSGGAKVNLKLGDIIQIHAPGNTIIHEQTFFIEYIDDVLVVLLDIASMQHQILHIDEEGHITDETIINITILSHSDHEGYARQNGLLPKIWLDIYFGGDVPTIITGEITNLEEDMIEITTFPDLDVIYIDFAYKGIPRDLPIQHIEIRSPPASLRRTTTLAKLPRGEAEAETAAEAVAPETKLDILANTDDYPAVPETTISIDRTDLPEKNMFDVLSSMYINADDIVFGEELEEVAQVVEVPESQRKYGVEIQANDMMDELLSTIPNAQRTKAIMGKIHVLIERFKQLREAFSVFDENGNVSGYIQLGALHKPIIERLKTLDTKLAWILPVVKQQRRIYTASGEGEEGALAAEEAAAAPDVIYANMSEEMDAHRELVKKYYKNAMPNGVNKYENLNTKLDEIQTSFVPASKDCDACLVQQQTVLTNIDAVIDNLDDFYSTTLASSTKKDEFDNLQRRRFVIQRYNLGMMLKQKQLLKSGKTVYTRNFMTPSDRMTVKSLLVLPEPAVRFSHIDLPTADIATKVNLHQHYLNLFRILRKNTDISTHIIDDLSKELPYRAGEADTDGLEFLSNFREYVLDENLQNDPEKFQKFLNVVIPKTRVLFRLIRKYIRNRFSFIEVVKELEPFMIYSNDISYKQHDEIRYFIKHKIIEWKQELVKRAQIFKNIRKQNYEISRQMNKIRYLLFDNKELLHVFETAYQMDLSPPRAGELAQVDVVKAALSHHVSEVLHRILTRDQSVLFSDIITTMMIKSLSTPESILDLFQPARIDDLSETEKIKAKECSRRYLAKRYHNMQDLRKDNGKDDVFYDKDLDDIPYELMEKYKKEQKTMEAKEFLEFMVLTLRHKHQVSSEGAEELAKTLIEGKKRVVDGEYATLEIKEKTGEGDAAMDITIYNRYFKRVKDHWVEDTSIDPSNFLDTNALFCNYADACMKNTENQQCEPAALTKRRMIEQTKARMKAEFDARLSGSIDEMERKIRAKLEADYKRMAREQLLTMVKLEKFNTLAYDFGRENPNKPLTTADAETPAVSPHWKLRDMILGQDDFQKRQTDIIQFVEMYCREPLIDELGENPHWLYCLDSNFPLFPQSLYKLAAEYVEGGEYPAKLAQICKDVGILSDDGDSIVDKHTGYVLRKIDFITQEEYSEEGMKIVSHAIMEEDLQTRLGKILIEGDAKRPGLIFENPQTQILYNIMRVLADNLGVPIESVQDFTLSTAGELMAKIIQSPELYEERAQLMEKKKGVRPIPYEIYKDRLMFWIIASCVLIAIQTAIPSIRIKKTFPGCVRSFSGYPLDGGAEDQTGIEYIACILFKSKSSIAPWNAIEKLDLGAYVAKIREMLEKIMAEHAAIPELYSKKKEYVLLNPNEVVPEEHSIVRWRGFLPPLVPYKMPAGGVRAMSREHEREMLDLVRDGHRKQREHLDLYHSRRVLNNYAIIDAIHDVVKAKELLLRTAGKVPFMENACCHGEDEAAYVPIAYFAKENPELLARLKAVGAITEFTRGIENLMKTTMIYHPGFTGIKYSTVGDVVLVENIYKAFFHYCNFDNDLPIPEPYRAVCPEKPSPAQGYKREWSVLEKVEFLKLNGKQYRPENLEQLMVIVRNQNRVVLPETAIFTQIQVVHDLLEAAQQNETVVIEAPFRQRLLAVLEKYNAQRYTHEPREELDQLKNYLAKSNEKMYYEIVDFMDKYGNMSNDEFSQFQDWLLTVFGTEQDIRGELYKRTQNAKNLVFYMSKYIPEMILNSKVYDDIPTHWELAPIHMRDLNTVLGKQWDPVAAFFGDKTLYEFLREIMRRLADLNIFVREFPAFSTIERDGKQFHSLLDAEATYMIYTYFLYSVIYEHVVCSEDPELLRLDVETAKQRYRKKIADANDDSNETRAEVSQMAEGAQEIDLDLQEVNIRVGSPEELKGRVAQMLRMYAGMDQKNRIMFASYDEIIRRTGLSKKEEKKRITDYLGNLPPEEREIEKQFMKFKMGQWNVGEQKGLYQYDKQTYERERAQQELGVFTVFMQSLDGSTGVDAAELDRERELEAAVEQDGEGMDFADFGEDYHDGTYYEEDRDMEFED